MKKLFIALFIFIVFCLNAEDFDFDDIPKDIKYCQVIGISYALDSAPAISIDFGQKWITKKTIKRGGKIFTFNSMIDVLNWMHVNGWEYVSSYVVYTGMTGYWHFYLLQRRN